MLKTSSPIKGKPLVSSVIAAYNVEHSLANCIESLLNQSYKPLEIIIVDDCSTDNTNKIAKEYSKKGLVKLYKTPHQSNGSPGLAWNVGAKKAKGKIIMTLGSNFIFGKDYIKDLIRPILDGKTIGTIHMREKVPNLDNLWSRAYCKERTTTIDGMGYFFALIRKDAFFKYGPFDTSLKYADDQTIYKKHGFRSLGVDAEIYHDNPDNFKLTWNHDLWVGKSFKNHYSIILLFPVFPLWVLYKTFLHLKRDSYWKFIFFLPIFYTLKYFAYLYVSIKRLINGN